MTLLAISQLREAIESLYAVFDAHPQPALPPVCELCGPGVDQARLRRTPLRAWSGADLVAIHVLSLPDNEVKYFFPRVLEVLLSDQHGAFEFGLSGLTGRRTGWLPIERDVIGGVIKAVLNVLLSSYPAAIGYVSSAIDLLEVADQLDLSMPALLDIVDQRQGEAADLHLASLVDVAYTTAGTAAVAVRQWLARPEVGQRLIGQRLNDAFYRAGDDAAANCLAAAHDLWLTCAPRQA